MHASPLKVMGTIYQTQSQGYENTTYQAHSQGNGKLLSLYAQKPGCSSQNAPIYPIQALSPGIWCTRILDQSSPLPRFNFSSDTPGTVILLLRFLSQSESLEWPSTPSPAYSPDSIPTLQGQEASPLMENTCTPLISAGVIFVVKHAFTNIHRADQF